MKIMRILGIISLVLAIGIAGGFDNGGEMTLGKIIAFGICLLFTIFAFFVFPLFLEGRVNRHWGRVGGDCLEEPRSRR